MRILSGIVGLALLSATSVAVADEPVELSNAALDSVVGGYSLLSVARAGPSFISGGASFTLSDVAQTNSVNFVELSPPNSLFEVSTFAQSQSVARVSGLGSISAGTGGSVFLAVIPPL